MSIVKKKHGNNIYERLIKMVQDLPEGKRERRLREKFIVQLRDTRKKNRILIPPQKIAKIVAASCQVWGVTPEQVQQRHRQREKVWARNFVYRYFNMYSDMSLKDMSNVFGGYDHTTVIHGIREVVDKLDVDYEVKEKWDKFFHLLEKKQATVQTSETIL